jgi:hypothetical protein
MGKLDGHRLRFRRRRIEQMQVGDLSFTRYSIGFDSSAWGCRTGQKIDLAWHKRVFSARKS